MPPQPHPHPPHRITLVWGLTLRTLTLSLLVAAFLCLPLRLSAALPVSVGATLALLGLGYPAWFLASTPAVTDRRVFAGGDKWGAAPTTTAAAAAASARGKGTRTRDVDAVEATEAWVEAVERMHASAATTTTSTNST